jgi:hypothetical protein
MNVKKKKRSCRDFEGITLVLRELSSLASESEPNHLKGWCRKGSCSSQQHHTEVWALRHESLGTCKPYPNAGTARVADRDWFRVRVGSRTGQCNIRYTEWKYPEEKCGQEEEQQTRWGNNEEAGEKTYMRWSPCSHQSVTTAHKWTHKHATTVHNCTHCSVTTAHERHFTELWH